MLASTKTEDEVFNTIPIEEMSADSFTTLDLAKKKVRGPPLAGLWTWKS